MSERVIKSEHVEVVSPAKGTPSTFVRLYTKKKKDVLAGSGRGDSSRCDATGTESVSHTERGKKDAYAKGYTEGMAKGIEDERKRLLYASESIAHALRELDALKKEILEGNEDKILNLVFSVSEKVINQEVSTRRDVVQNVIKSALRHTIDKEGIKIRLNPEDYRYITDINPGFIESIDDIRNMTLVEDNAIQRGGVVIETSSGEIDARLEQQLHEIKKAVSVAQ